MDVISGGGGWRRLRARWREFQGVVVECCICSFNHGGGDDGFDGDEVEYSGDNGSGSGFTRDNNQNYNSNNNNNNNNNRDMASLRGDTRYFVFDTTFLPHNFTFYK